MCRRNFGTLVLLIILELAALPGLPTDRATPAESCRPIAAVLGLAMSLGISTGTASAKDAPQPCAAPECRQFDFWIGDWEVRTPEGTLVGNNRIEPILDGCALQEHWSGASGTFGTSLNMFSLADRRWHQTWVDTHGLLLQLAGEFRDGRMVLSGEVPRPDGPPTKHRITWERLEDGSVRQHWESSGDGGQSWEDAFIGIYRRK